MSDIDKTLNSYTGKVFDEIKHVMDDSTTEFWSARELQETLEYAEWRNFMNIINKAKISCINSGFLDSDHFVDVNKMVSIGSSTSREIKDIVLSRYACYLIVQNGDPNKPIIALGQTYFAKATREHELAQAYNLISEDEKRLKIRENIKEHNKSLAQAASLAGITAPYDYAIFQNKGYQGLYGGLDN